VRHDDERQRAVCVGPVDPRSTPQIAGLELDFVTRERHALAPRIEIENILHLTDVRL
jgi:hypothetical protein